ncbi:MAG TPA: SDR family oxidoreductase [Solirubrobacterales bacterium]|nr:SDR family oxidoreductase [Solirubrobacterales bacterium]
MAKERRSLNGKVVAITGGARGIGKATAEALARRGARLALGDVDLATAEATAAELGGGSIALALDVSDRGSFERFLDEAERQLGTVDVVINNAGIMPVTPFVEESEDSFRRQIEINLIGVINGTQLALQRMLPRNSGHIVNIASQAGKTGVPGIATYSATKHAVVGLCESVRGEIRGRAIDISCVMPTIVNTELTSGVVDQRFVKPIEAVDVAEAIVGALEVPRFDVYVPKSNGALLRGAYLMPRAAAEWVGRTMGTDKLMTEVDHGARAAYESRVTQSGGDHASDDESAPTGASVPADEAAPSTESGSAAEDHAAR